MAAGESARQEAQRRREQITRLAREAEMFERGAAGEEATGAVLDSLSSHGWVHLADVRWPGRPRANIDHVVIGPGGVFVIDTKNWTGTVQVRGDVLRQNGYRRDHVVAGAASGAAAVGLQLPRYARKHLQPVLCFVGDHEVAGRSGSVLVCSVARLEEMLTQRRMTLTGDQVAECSSILRANLTSASRAPRSRREPVSASYSHKQVRPRPRKRPGFRRPAFGLLLILLLMVVAQNLSRVTDLFTTLTTG